SKETAIEIIKQKQKEDAPIGYYKELPVTKGTGRFGPFVKWNGIFVNVPKRINFEKLNLDDVKPLIDAKEVKEANRFILKFDEDKITVENGRWGPYIKYGKKLINFPKKDGQRITADQAAKMTLEDIKSIIQEQIPTAFVKKERKKKAK
ncbi:MAG: topoisomerase C-terminal repeat-containing protein, partial [Saprospiraceae bacterium]